MDQFLQQVASCGEKTEEWLNKENELKCKITYNAPPVPLKDDTNSLSIAIRNEPKPITKLIRNYDELKGTQDSDEEGVVAHDVDDDDDDGVFEEISMRDNGYSLDDDDNPIIFTLKPPKTSLVYLMREMVNHHVNTNVQINISNVYINCHLCLLQVYSKFFMDMEYAMVIKLPSEKISVRAFMAIYKWMLSDEPKILRKDIADVFLAGSYLYIDALLEHCWSYFDSDSCFSEDAAAIFYVETAMTPELDVVSNAMLMRIRRFFLPFVASSHFVELPVKHLIYLLDTPFLGVNSEIEVFYAAVRWVEHNWEERKGKICKIFKHVRYDLMPGWFLLGLPNSRETKTIHQIMSINEMFLYVHEAIGNVTVLMYDCLLEDKFKGRTIEKVLTEYSLNKRLWIEDKSCSFHHHISCTEMPQFRYGDFLDYLKVLQSGSPNYWKEALNPIDRTKPCCERNKLFQLANE